MRPEVGRQEGLMEPTPTTPRELPFLVHGERTSLGRPGQEPPQGDAAQPDAAASQAYPVGSCVSPDGTGAVYETTHPRLTGRFVIKLFARSDALALADFRAEAERLSQLRHPHIAQVVEAG